MRNLLLLITLSLLVGCDFFVFNPEGNHHVKIDSEPKKLDVSWENSGDTLGVWGDVKLSYDIELDPDASPREVYLYLGEEEVSRVDFGDTLAFESFDLEDGIYKSYLIASASSGTKSLVDRLGGETALAVDSTKYIWVDNDRMDEISIKNFTLRDDGSLKIEWEQYQRPRFTSYEVYEDISSKYRTEITDIDSTSWIDYNYDGRDRDYYIKAKYSKWDNAEGPKKTFSTSREPSSLTDIHRIGSTQIKFEWTKTRYPHPFRSYSIVRYDDLFYPTEQIFTEILEIDKTETQITSPLGSEYFYYLNVSSYPFRDYHDPQSKISDSVRVSVGLKFSDNISDIKMLAYDSTRGRFVVFSEGNLFSLDSSSKEILKSVNIGNYEKIAFSESLNQIVTSKEDKIYVYEGTSFGLIKTIDFSDFYPSLSPARISDLMLDKNGILWYKKREYDYARGAGAIDLNTEQLVDSLNFNDNSDTYFFVHQDAQLFIGNIEEKSGYAIYEYDGTNVKTFRPLDGVSKVRFSPDGDSYYGISNYHDLILKRLSDHKTIWKITLPRDRNSFSVNHEKNNFSYISREEGGMITRSFVEGSVIGKIEYAKTSLRADYFTSNDIVWLRNGFYEEIINLK